MIRKNYSRRVFLIEVIQNEKVLGYYAGKDWDNSVVIKGLHGAMIIKKEKGVSHIVNNLERFYCDLYSFKVTEAIESQTIIFYDEYEKEKDAKPLYAIRVKEKTDLLAEACFVSEIDKNEGTFNMTFAIEKAMLLGEKNSWKACKFLSERYNKVYKFYQEEFFVKKESTIELR